MTHKGSFIINGNQRFDGQITASSSKNAILPIIAASVLSKNEITIRNCPNISDVNNMLSILTHKDISVNKSDNNSIKIKATNINNNIIPNSLASQLRTSCLLIAPIIARTKSITIAMPGGCNIGERPINIHLALLKKFGAKIIVENGYITAEAPYGFKGCHFIFPKITVGGTENALMASTLAIGKTTLENIAIEPEIIDLVDFLNKLGANIEIDIAQKIAIIDNNNKQNNTLNSLGSSDMSYTVIPDRIEILTYIIGVATIGKELLIHNVCIQHIQTTLDLLYAIGAISYKYDALEKSLIIKKQEKQTKNFNIQTNVYPGYPTDIQPLLTVMALICDGVSCIQENIFDTRFSHISELKKMGAKIEICKNNIVIYGKQNNLLKGGDINARDLRGAASLLIASMLTRENDTTIINNIQHIHRGYDSIIEKMKMCGIYIQEKIHV